MIDIQYVDRYSVCQRRYKHVCRMTCCMSIDRHAQYWIRLPHCYLVWCSCTDQSASRHNYWQKCEKNAYSLIFVPKCSIIASLGLVISCYCMLSRKTMYADWHTVSRLTYNISFAIHVCMLIEILYVNQDTVCRSRYCMSISCCA